MPNGNLTITRTCHCDDTEIFSYRDWPRRMKKEGVMMDEEALREAIYLAMDTAEDNGYTFEGWSNDQIAIDLTTYDKSFENVDTAQLYAHIQSWRNKQYGIPE